MRAWSGWRRGGGMAVLLVASACGSSVTSSGTGTGASTNTDACLSAYVAALGGPSTCIPCAEQKCASGLASLTSACSSFLSCSCPGGTFSDTAYTSTTCQADESASSCQSARNNFVTDCVSGTCSAECSGSGTGGSSSTPSGSATASSSSG